LTAMEPNRIKSLAADQQPKKSLETGSAQHLGHSSGLGQLHRPEALGVIAVADFLIDVVGRGKMREFIALRCETAIAEQQRLGQNRVRRNG
jgi:hypothetical protein